MQAVEIVGRRDGESYRDFIERIARSDRSAGALAREVKLVDLAENLACVPLARVEESRSGRGFAQDASACFGGSRSPDERGTPPRLVASRMTTMRASHEHVLRAQAATAVSRSPCRQTDFGLSKLSQFLLGPWLFVSMAVFVWGFVVPLELLRLTL